MKEISDFSNYESACCNDLTKKQTNKILKRKLGPVQLMIFFNLPQRSKNHALCAKLWFGNWLTNNHLFHLKKTC